MTMVIARVLVCRCPRLKFPHRYTDACDDLADEQRERAREIAQQQSSELAAERGRSIRSLLL